MSEQNSRPKFKSRKLFLFAMMGSVIGLGNIWRFPSVLYTNGGASFLIAYLSILFILGVSHLFLEYGIGFKFKSSVSGVFSKINKKYEVIGWFLPLNIFLVLTYYVCILSWGLIYFLLSFSQAWGTNTNGFFNNLLLNSATPTVSGTLSFSIPILVGLIVLWFLIWLATSRDLDKAIGAICRYLMSIMFILMVFVVIFTFTLPGSMVGIHNLFKPNWAMLLTPGLWLVVLAQIAFSMGLGDSTAISFTSYLEKESKLMDNAIIVTVINFLFGIVASLGVFSILGFMSSSQGVPFNTVVTEGTGLVFVAFPTIFNTMGMLSYIIAPLFFLCFLFAGFTSAIALFEPMSSSLSDKFNFSRFKSASIMAIVGLSISLLFATGSGQYMVNVADSFLNEITLSVVILCEAIVFAWIYGADKLKPILNENSKFQIGTKWIFIVKYLMPMVIIFLLINGIYNFICKNTLADYVVQLFFVSILVIVPIILTKLAARNKNFYKENSN
ncbi:MAG: sodium-dependent transporter [archaeon]|nr:sodium-dependent transporter [archaeon]